MGFPNGCNKIIIEFRVVQFWPEISIRTRAERSFERGVLYVPCVTVIAKKNIKRKRYKT